jgi:hypothetical protein
MTLNLEAEIDPTKWTALQVEVCMNVANAKIYAFVAETERMAELVRLGLIPRATAADYLNEAAVYNQLYYDYGAEHIQSIMAVAFAGQAAAC